MLGQFLSFHLVKKMGEGNYLNEDSFIIERVRKERALDTAHAGESKKFKRKNRLTRNGKFSFS